MGAVADLQSYLREQSLVDGATGWPSVRRRVFDTPGDQLVTLTEDGGIQPETPAFEGMGDVAWRQPMVQVRVRAEPWDGDAAEDQAQQIYDAVHGLLGVEMGETVYIGVHAMTEPVFIGFDERGRPEITVSFRMTRPVAPAPVSI